MTGFDLHEQALIDEQVESEWFFSLESCRESIRRLVKTGDALRGSFRKGNRGKQR